MKPIYCKHCGKVAAHLDVLTQDEPMDDTYPDPPIPAGTRVLRYSMTQVVTRTRHPSQGVDGFMAAPAKPSRRRFTHLAPLPDDLRKGSIAFPCNNCGANLTLDLADLERKKIVCGLRTPDDPEFGRVGRDDLPPFGGVTPRR